MIYPPKNVLVLTILMVFLSFQVKSQKNITHQQLIWYAYVNSLEINSKINLVSEIHDRRYFRPDAQHQFAVRERLHFIFNPNWDIALCFVYFLQSPNDPYSTSTLVIPELRPHVDINYKQIFKHITLTHRLRTEHRFFRNHKDGELIAGYNSNWRFRYQLGFEIPLFKFKKEQAIGLKIGDELFINAGKNIKYNTFDHNRYYFSITYSPIKSLTIEAGYMHWFQQRSSGIAYYDRDIIRLSITQKIRLKR